MKRSYLLTAFLFLIILAAVIIYYTRFYGDIATYEGVYLQSHNITDFKPCGSSQHWWLSFNEGSGNVDSMYNAATEQFTRETFMRFTGREVDPGEHGHVGYYDRNFEVIEIDTLRTLLSKDCK